MSARATRRWRELATAVVVGNVIVTQGGSVMRGQRLVVDLTSGVSKMDRADVLLPRGASEARKP